MTTDNATPSATSSAPAWLGGIRVLDLSRLIPGGLATKRLVELGAEVVKIEEPGRGDYLRSIPPFVDGEGIMDRALNAGKLSVELDLKTQGGRDLLAALARVADVIVEVSRPGRFLEMGVDFEAMCRDRPQLVICSVSGFGQHGPLSRLPSHGMNIDAAAGCAEVDLSSETPRIATRNFVSLGAELGGVNAALAIVAALFSARSTGRGAWIDASCWDAAVEANRVAFAHLRATDEPLHQIGDMGPLYDVYETKDGEHILFAAIEKRFWDNFCDEVGRDDLKARWRAEGAEVDFGLDAGLRQEIAALIAARTVAEWEAIFLGADVPGSQVRELKDVLSHAHFHERGLASANGGLASPVALRDGSRFGAELRRAPALGQDTEDVLTRWLDLPATSGKRRDDA